MFRLDEKLCTIYKCESRLSPSVFRQEQSLSEYEALFHDTTTTTIIYIVFSICSLVYNKNKLVNRYRNSDSGPKCPSELINRLNLIQKDNTLCRCGHKT